MLPSVTVKLTAGAVEDQFILCVSLGFSLFMGFVNNIRTQQPDIGKWKQLRFPIILLMVINNMCKVHNT